MVTRIDRFAYLRDLNALNGGLSANNQYETSMRGAQVERVEARASTVVLFTHMLLVVQKQLRGTQLRMRLFCGKRTSVWY